MRLLFILATAAFAVTIVAGVGWTPRAQASFLKPMDCTAAYEYCMDRQPDSAKRLCRQFLEAKRDNQRGLTPTICL